MKSFMPASSARCRSPTIDQWHLHVHEDDVQRLVPGTHIFNGCRAVRAGGNDGTLLFQDSLRHLQIDVAVIHHQHIHARQPLRMPVIESGELQQALDIAVRLRNRRVDCVE
jgi:hypothetical protein